MNGLIDTLKFTDSNGEKFNLYPRTLIECISNRDGDNLEDTLKEFVSNEIPNNLEDSLNETSELGVKNKVITTAINDIVDGTTPAGDSAKLGGKSASEYAQVSNGNTLEIIIADHNYVHDYIENTVPITPAFGNYTHYIHKAQSGAVLSVLSIGIEYTDKIYIYSPSSGKWVEITDTADLANYLPLRGGRIEGATAYPLILKSGGSVSYLRYMNSSYASMGSLGFAGVNNPVYALNDDSIAYSLLHSGNVGSYALPKSGGTVNGLVKLYLDSTVALEIGSRSSNTNLIKFLSDAFVLGYLGFHKQNVPCVYGSDGQFAGTLLHTGNKPTGSYTGNGSATQRQIQTGGVGSAVVVWGNSGMFIATPSGILGGTNGGSNTANYGAGNFTNGVLTIGSDSAILNANGVTYTYQVL